MWHLSLGLGQINFQSTDSLKKKKRETKDQLVIIHACLKLIRAQKIKKVVSLQIR